MVKLTAKKRARMRKSTFALPAKKSAKRGSPAVRNRYPLDTLARARSALSRVSGNGTSAEKKKVARAVKRRFPSLGKSDFVKKWS